MKTKLFLIVGFLIIVSVMMVAPVAALEAKTAVSGTLAKTVSLGVAETGTIILTPGSTTTLLLTLSASQNCAGTITAVDPMTPIKSPDTNGHMANWTIAGDGAYPDIVTQGPNPATKLTAKMTLQGASAGVYTAEGLIVNLGSVHTLYTISGGGSNGALGATFSQFTALTDTPLPGTNIYRIPVSFVISCA